VRKDSQWGQNKDCCMNVSLVLVQVDGKQREIPLKKAVQVIGRQTDCQLRIPSGNVSRHHCEVKVTDEGAISIRDLGSSNGTYVNKQKITQTSVKAGDLISLGGLVFVVKIDGKPGSVDSEDVLEDGLVEVPGGGVSAPEARPTAATMISPPSKLGGPTRESPANLDDSSVADFDFLDDDDDLKGQPKL